MHMHTLNPHFAHNTRAVLLGLVAATTASFANVDATAGKLMVPYLAFTAFANYLNYGIIKKNPGEAQK